jgi:hypothetical protein
MLHCSRDKCGQIALYIKARSITVNRLLDVMIQAQGEAIYLYYHIIHTTIETIYSKFSI